MSRTTTAHLGLSLLGLALLPAVVAAAPLAPGGSVLIQTDEEPFALPTGPKLAEKVIPFTLNYGLPPGTTNAFPAPTTTGTLTQSVYRNTSTGGLTFVYDLDVANQNEYTDEVSILQAGSFANVSTDVRGDNPDTSYFSATRSADGATIRTMIGEGLGAPPTMLVDTDATTFDERGTGLYYADDEFYVFDTDPGEGETTDLNATANFTGLYHPVVVPESAAGGLALLACGALSLCRKRRD